MSYSFKELYNIVNEESRKAIDKYIKEITELKSINRVDNYVNEFVESKLSIDDDSFVYNIAVDKGCNVVIEDGCVVLGCEFVGKGSIKINKGSILIGSRIETVSENSSLEITNSYLLDTTVYTLKDAKNKIKNSILIYGSVHTCKCKNFILDKMVAVNYLMDIAGTKSNSLILCGSATLSDSVNSLYLVPDLKIGYILAVNMFRMLNDNLHINRSEQDQRLIYIKNIRILLVENGIDTVDADIPKSSISIDAPRVVYENANLYIQGFVKFIITRRVEIEGSLYVKGAQYAPYIDYEGLKLGSLQSKNGSSIFICGNSLYAIKSYTGTYGNLKIDNQGTFICTGNRCVRKRQLIYEAKNIHIKEEGFYII